MAGRQKRKNPKEFKFAWGFSVFGAGDGIELFDTGAAITGGCGALVLATSLKTSLKQKVPPLDHLLGADQRQHGVTSETATGIAVSL
jgi:hypothetical protein